MSPIHVTLKAIIIDYYFKYILYYRCIEETNGNVVEPVTTTTARSILLFGGTNADESDELSLQGTIFFKKKALKPSRETSIILF